MSDDASAALPAASSVLFKVVADFGPGVLPRLLQPLARRNLVPEKFAARLEGGALAVEIRLAGVSSEMLGLIEGNLRQVVGVRRCASVPAPELAAPQ
jgi:uncharacterized membrane protein